MAGGNRAQRRAAAQGNPTYEFVSSASDIPLQQPDRSGPKARTLLDIAEEKRRELLAKYPQGCTAEDEDMRRAEERDFLSSEPLGPFGEALVYTASLSMLHFTLDVLVFNQYRQEIDFGEIFNHLWRMSPALFCIVYLLHSRTAHRLPLAKQAFFFIISGIAGCYLILSGNRHGYYAVMRKAPPLGTLWIWAVVEMKLTWAVTHVAVVLLFTWWNGFTTF